MKTPLSTQILPGPFEIEFSRAVDHTAARAPTGACAEAVSAKYVIGRGWISSAV
jgi:hypothetical protein